MKLIRSLWVATFLLASACRASGNSPVPGEPVEECVQYEQAVANCYHRTDIAIASEPSLIPHTHAEKSRIQEVCRQNLERFKMACR